MSVQYRNGLYIKGRRKVYIGFCLKCERETPHRRFTCGVCKFVRPPNAKTLNKISHRESMAELFKRIGPMGVSKAVNKRHAQIRNAKRESFKQSADKFRKMFEEKS